VEVGFGGELVFTSPHIVEQPPCSEVGVNCFDIFVFSTNFETVGSSTANHSRNHKRKWNGGTPGWRMISLALHGADSGSRVYSRNIGIVTRSIIFTSAYGARFMVFYRRGAENSCCGCTLLICFHFYENLLRFLFGRSRSQQVMGYH